MVIKHSICYCWSFSYHTTGWKGITTVTNKLWVNDQKNMLSVVFVSVSEWNGCLWLLMSPVIQWSHSLRKSQQVTWPLLEAVQSLVVILPVFPCCHLLSIVFLFQQVELCQFSKRRFIISRHLSSHNKLQHVATKALYLLASIDRSRALGTWSLGLQILVWVQSRAGHHGIQQWFFFFCSKHITE